MSGWHRVLFGPARGALLPIDWRSQKRMFLGVIERELWSAYRRLLKPGMRAFDIGGSDGYCALLINRITRAEVISFECEHASVERMRDVFERNHVPVTAHEAWIGDGDGRHAALTIDQAAARFFAPDFMKIDIEGGEAAALRGGAEVLRRKPPLIIEVHSVEQERECLEILARHGYRVAIVDQARFFRERRPLPHNRWLVCD